MATDLRSFLRTLEREGQLVRYSQEVWPEPDVRGIARAAADMGETGPAVLLDSIRGYRGQELVLNIHGSWANHALMLGMPRTTTLKDQFTELAARWDNYPGEVRWVENAPCQEHVIDKDINLFQLLPLFKVNENDGGFYLSKASCVTRDPDAPEDFDLQNVGIYRLQVQNKDTLAMQGLPFHGRGHPPAQGRGAEPAPAHRHLPWRGPHDKLHRQHAPGLQRVRVQLCRRPHRGASGADQGPGLQPGCARWLGVRAGGRGGAPACAYPRDHSASSRAAIRACASRSSSRSSA